MRREGLFLSKAANLNTPQDRTFILESMPVNQAIWTLAIPTMAAMLIQVIYNMTDTFFIGKLGNPHMVAAISLSLPIFMIVQAFGNIFATGGASLISRLLGKGEREKACQAGAISFWSALTVCIFISLLAFLFVEPILMSCGASENTIGFGKSYLSIMLLGSPFIGIKMTLAGLLRSEGATREAMVGLMSGSILNILLDPVFIFVFDMDVAGAAVATVIGNIVGFIYLVSFYLKKKGIISISPKYYSFNLRVYADIFKIGIPASLGMALMSTGFAVANVYAAGFGDDVVAANGVVMRSTNIAVMLIMGLGHGCQPLMGYSYGAGLYGRLMEVIKRAITIGTVISSSFAIFFFLFPDFTVQIFINDPRVIELGVKIIRWLALAMPVFGVQVILMTMFQSLGKTVQSLIISLGRQGLFYIPALIIFSTSWGFNGFIFALPFADVVTTMLSFTLFLLMKKKLFDPSEKTLDNKCPTLSEI